MSLIRAKECISAKKMELYATATEPGFYSTHPDSGQRRLNMNPAAYRVHSIERIGENVRLVFSTTTGDVCLVVPVSGELE